MNARCAAEFTGGHLCHTAEYWLSNSATPPPATGAWLDSSGAVDDGTVLVTIAVGAPEYGIHTGPTIGNCMGWTSTLNTDGQIRGPIIRPAGATLVDCASLLPLTCCSTPYRERFAGFTSFTANGVIGGEAMANYRCATEFAGSHLCHVAEYYRAHPTLSPPAEGAWVDTSAVPWLTSVSYAPITNAAIARAGRLLIYGRSCNSWTEATGNALSVIPSGPAGFLCTTTRGLACCL
jgi:hypothetical protein